LQAASSFDLFITASLAHGVETGLPRYCLSRNRSSQIHSFCRVTHQACAWHRLCNSQKKTKSAISDGKMKARHSGDSIGRLEIIFYVAALLLGLGSIVGAWTFSILIALILFAILYGILRDALALSRSKSREKRSAAHDHAQRVD